MTNYIAEINKENNVVNGYYVEGIHGKEKCDELLNTGALLINEELWQQLLSYGQTKVDIEGLAYLPLTLEGKENCLTIEHSSYFSKYESPEVATFQHTPSKVEILEDEVENLNNKIKSVDDKLNLILSKLTVNKQLNTKKKLG